MTKEIEKGYNLTREEVINGYRWREGLIPLSLSKHAKRRTEERVEGEFPIVPTVVRITKGNICSGRTKDRKTLTSVKIRLEYKRDKWMFLVICPASGVVKTLYINDKHAKKRQGVEERECCIEEGPLKEEDKGERTITIRTDREGYNALVHGQPMGEAPKRKAMLGVWWKNIRGQFKRLLGPLAGEESVSRAKV